MWKSFKEHPVVGWIVSIAVVLAAIVSVLANGAQIWTAMSHDTVPEFLTKSGWLLRLPTWQATLGFLVSIIILALQSAILREAWTQRMPSAPTDPTMMLFTHDEARIKNPAVANRVRDLFEKAGWKMEVGVTSLPQHGQGIWLHGGTTTERTTALWGLATIDLAAQIDYTDDHPPCLQVIVGACEPQQLDPVESDRAAQQAQLLQEHSAAVAERESLRTALQEAQQERESLRGQLGHAQHDWLAIKEQFALARIGWFARTAKAWESPVTVTIRFADYADFALVKQIEAILNETGWPIVIDGGNSPVLEPSGQFKVIFESGLSAAFDPIAHAFSDGRLLQCPVGRRLADRGTMTHLVIEVLPTVRA